MSCTNARDTITQSAGLPLPNHHDYPDSEHVVTSSCRTTDGTWIAWKNILFGDSTDPSSGLPDNDTDKTHWPARIASAYSIGVGFFPDDGTIPIVYELGIDPTYEWASAGFYGARDPCSLWPFLGDKYGDSNKSELQSWAPGLIDVEVRTDGTNVWLIALAREAVKYPFLYNSPTEIDHCGHSHPTFEADWAGGHSDPFIHDTSSGTRWWKYLKGSPIGGDMPFGPYDDAGNDNSFRWQPARVTVWAGDTGGFTRLDTIEAKFDNANESFGLCSGIEAAASPADPGVLHLLWAEGGQFGVQPIEPKRGQRINYSRWNFTSKLLDTDLRYVEEDGSGFVSDANWVWTGEMILRNDHGAPVAIVWPWTTDGVSRFASAAAEFWDISSGTADVLQVADVALAPTAGEGNDGGTPQSVFGWLSNASLQIGSLGFSNIRRSQYASSAYTDPTLDNTDVYLLCVGYGQGVERAGCQAFLRIPCDGSAGFDYLDGTRSVGYSIIPGDTFVDFFGGSEFRADFVSDPDNVWMPASTPAGGGVMHLYRRCIPAWELLPAFPVPDPATGYEDGDWANENNVSPPAIVTDAAGDWLAGSGTGPQLTVLSADPTNIAALRAKICRCCVPCQPLGVRLWKRV